jgi:two-component system cell cycle sensor histidine kinase/response regulator CckA
MSQRDLSMQTERVSGSLSAAPLQPGDPLALRRHVAAIADLGRNALGGGDLERLFGDACELVARALAIDYVAVVEDLGEELALRAQWGWPSEIVFTERLPRRASSQAAYTLDNDDVILLADAAAETRFHVSQPVIDFGVVSGISVPVRGRGRPFGVLAAHSRERRAFSDDESVFLGLVANVLGGAVESARAAEAEHARQHLLSTLVEHGPDIVLRLDRNLRHLYVSPVVELATGHPPEWFLGKTTAELGFPEAHVDLWTRELRHVLETAEPSRFEFQLGGRWFESHAVAEPGAGGTVESIVIFTRDRTEARSAEVRYRELFEHATDMIFIVGMDGTFVDVNPAVERALGYAQDELIGQHFDLVVAPGDRGMPAERLRRKLDGSESTSVYEMGFVTRTGRLLPVQASSRSIVRDGKPAGVLAIVRDISAEKVAAAALAASEQLFRGAFDDAAVGMLLTTPAGEIVRVNAAFARMLGYEPEELAGKTIDETTHPDDIESTSAFIELLVDGTSDTHRGEKRYRTKDGETRWCQVGLSAVRAEDGSVPYLVAQVEDVTELRRVQAELQESQALHRVVVESSRDLIMVLDLDGTVRLVSHSVEDILGYRRDELVGTSFDRLVHPDDLAVAQAALERALVGDPVITQARVLRKDGSWRVLEGKASGGLNGEGRPAFLVTNARDVTDRMWLEEQLRQSQKMEAIGKLAGGVAHDFNNLLTVINGYSDVALSTLPPELEDTRHSVEEIRRAGERAAELTHQLLAFSRRQVLRPEAVDLNEVVEGCLTMLERIVGEDVAVHTSLDASLPPLLADPGQLGQVVLNLAVNARDAMPDGGELRITTSMEGGAPTLTVSDTGHGMAPDIRQRIFEPFFTTKEQGKGTGMGLSTVLGIVEQSGGSIDVESAPGRGTSFRISLQAAPDAVAPSEPPERDPERASEAATILLVEDEPLVRGIVEEMLVALGHRVIATAGPGAALEVASTAEPFDLVLTDVVMPEMNGHELASRVAELRPGVRVLYISGYTGDVVEARGVLDAHDCFLQKPFSVDALGAKVRAALTARV